MFKRIHSLLNVFVIISLAVPWTSVTPAQPALAASAPQEASASTGIFRTRVTLTDPTSRARLDKLGVTVLSEAPQPPTPGEPVPFGIGGTGEPISSSMGGAGGAGTGDCYTCHYLPPLLPIHPPDVDNRSIIINQWLNHIKQAVGAVESCRAEVMFLLVGFDMV